MSGIFTIFIIIKCKLVMSSLTYMIIIIGLQNDRIASGGSGSPHYLCS